MDNINNNQLSNTKSQKSGIKRKAPLIEEVGTTRQRVDHSARFTASS